MELKNHRTPSPDEPARKPASSSPGNEGSHAHALPAGARLNEFEIIRLIAASHADMLYLAYDHATQRNVALREYLPASLASRLHSGHVAPLPMADEHRYLSGLHAFLSEARLLSRFDSPSLVQVLRYWEANGTGYMAMPFYEGSSLLEASASGRIQPNEDWIRALLSPLLDAVEMLHAQDCHHPAIAPGNILLLADGRPLLLDFGAARRVVGGATGTAAGGRSGYAPIEEYDDIPNLKPGPWTDVYALAAVAYFLVAGQAPPAAPARLSRDEMTPARQAGAGRYSETFLAALDQALAVKPEGRFQSIPAFRRALGIREDGRRPGREDRISANAAGIHRAGRQPGMRPYPLGQDPGSRLRRVRARRITVLAAFALVAVALSAGVWNMRQHADGPAGAGSPDQPAAIAGKAPGAPGQASRAPAADAPPAPPAPPAPSAPAQSDSAQEETQWLLASSLNNAAAYQAYLAAYPDGRFAASARTALERIRGAAEQAPAPAPAPVAAAPVSQEDALWDAVRGMDNRLLYESYLSKYPNGRHAADARASLARLRSIPAWQLPDRGPGREAANGSPAAGANGRGIDRMAAVPVPPSAPVPAPQASPAAPARGDQTAGPTRLPREQAAANPAAAPPPAAEAAETDPTQEAASEREPAQAPVTGRSRTLRLPNQIMTGDFTPDPVSGLVSGRGRIVWDNGDQFDGSMVRGQKEGRGEFRWANGQRYSGDWSRDQPNGKGTIQFPNGDRYTGDMRAGLPNGTGTLLFANGNRYRGEVRDGLPHGAGQTRFSNGDVYSGSWSGGKSHGQGRYTWADGSYWEGEFRNDAKTDNGRLVRAPGQQSQGEPPSAAAGGLPAGTAR